MKQLTYKTRPRYDCRNRCSFNRFLKMSRDGAEVPRIRDSEICDPGILFSGLCLQIGRYLVYL